MGILDDVTTNPSLMAKENVKGKEQIMAHYKTICDIVDGPVSAEIFGHTCKFPWEKKNNLSKYLY